MVGTNLPDDSLQQMVDKTILLVDGNGDGKLSFEEFNKLVSRGNLGVKLAESCKVLGIIGRTLVSSLVLRYIHGQSIFYFIQCVLTTEACI